MTKIKCDVKSCSFENNNTCSKKNVTVMGFHAKRSSETICNSFREVSKDNFITEFAKEFLSGKQTTISCDADSCNYSINKKCSAKSIDVTTFYKNTEDKHDTYCTTYKK